MRANTTSDPNAIDRNDRNILNKNDRNILEYVGRYGLEDGLTKAARANHMALQKTYERYQQIIGKGFFPATIDLNTDLSRWEFADACRQYNDTGMCVQAIANLMKCTFVTVKRWIEVSRAFAPEYRFPEIPPSAYLNLVRMPEPLSAALFARRERLSSVQTLHLYRRYLQYKRREHFHPTGKQFQYVDEDEILKCHRKTLSVRDTAEVMGISMKTAADVLKKHGAIHSFIEPKAKKVEHSTTAKLGISLTNNELSKENPCRKGDKKNIGADEELLFLYNSGLSDREIADTLGTSRVTVIRRRQELGLPALKKVGGRGRGRTKSSIEPQRPGSSNDKILVTTNSITLQPFVELQKQIDLLQQENANLCKKLSISQKLCSSYLHELGRKTGLRYRIG